MVLVDGFKRLRAARTLKGVNALHARQLEIDEQAAKAAIFNLNRLTSRPNEREESWIIYALVHDDGLQQIEVAHMLGRHKSWINRRLALIERLTDEAREALRLGLLTPTQARHLTGLPRGNQNAAMRCATEHALTSRESKLAPFAEQLQQLLERYPDLTALRALEELQQAGFTGSYSTVRTYLKSHRIKPKAKTVRFETAPGAQAQMDWSTYHIDFTAQGRRRVELFSYILGYSRRQYICFTERQDFDTTVRQHIAAFEHLGGAAAVCLYDNMKVVVTRWEDGQPIYNTRFLSFATHYGFKA